MSGAVLFQNGCLGAFWDGFWNTGWPSDNRWVNLVIDVLNEELAGQDDPDGPPGGRPRPSWRASARNMEKRGRVVRLGV